MSRPRLSRRRFLTLAAAGTTAAAAGGAIAATDPAPRKRAKKSGDAKPAAPPVYATPAAPSEEIRRGRDASGSGQNRLTRSTRLPSVIVSGLTVTTNGSAAQRP